MHSCVVICGATFGCTFILSEFGLADLDYADGEKGCKERVTRGYSSTNPLLVGMPVVLYHRL